MKVNTPSAVPSGTFRQQMPATTRLNTCRRRRLIHRPDRMLRMPVVHPISRAAEPIRMNIHPNIRSGRTGGGGTGAAGRVVVPDDGDGVGTANACGLDKAATPMTMWTMKMHEMAIVRPP